jgi:sec-independent protein translocase protein TatA
LALMGYEWLVVIAVIAIIFLWGPSKLPELARSVGLARKEFEKASKEITAPTTSTTTESSPSTSSDSLIIAAKELGISTEGKTKEEIAKEIAEKATKK